MPQIDNNAAPRGQSSSGSITLTPKYSVTLPGNGGKRQGKPKLIILHNTDGPNQSGSSDLRSTEQTLRSRNLSVHVVNDGEGNCARLCPDDIVAFHAQGWNAQSLGIEQVGKIGQPLSAYSAAQIANTAMWIAYWSKKYDIPIKHSNSHGICGHSETKGNPSGTDCMTGAYPWKQVLEKAAAFADKVVEGDPDSLDGSSNSTSAATGGIDAQTAEKISKAAAFSTYLELPGLLNTLESMSLKGERSLLNDQPLLPFVEQISRACLRSFQSLPNGDFYAFYPDYFGGLNHNTPYWDISDIEIQDGQIELSDDALATHVYVVGDTVAHFDGVNTWDKAQTGGVVTLFNAFLADFMNPTVSQMQRSASKRATADKTSAIENVPTLANKDKALAFLRKYGARPYFEAAPMVRSPYYEAFLAYQTFCLLWSRQFVSQFKFTFMPELYPGGIVRMPQHGVQMFVEEVVHSFSYADGFETHAVLSAPASTEGASGPNVHAGMIREGALNVNSPSNKGNKK